MIPKDWDLAPLPDVVWYQEGPGVRNYQFTSSGVKLFNGTNIENGKIRLDNTSRYISEREAYGWYSHFLADAGDIVIACSGISVSKFDEKVGVLSNADLPLCMNTSTMRFKVSSPRLHKDYFRHFLRSQRFKQQISGTATGSAQLNFGPAHIRSAVIPLPTLAEQEAIAEALSDADALIESLEQIIAKKRQIKQGAMQELLTGKRRLPGFATVPGRKQTEVGMIPEDWVVERLGSLCAISAAGDLVKEEFAPESDYGHEFPIYSNALARKGLYGYSKSFRYEPDKITVTARGDIGHATYRSTRFCAIGRLLVLSSRSPCDLRFIAEYMNEFVRFAFESTGVPQLTAPQISNYSVALPPSMVEQTAVAAILSDMDAEIEALEAKLSKARQIKQGMMQELLTGRIRLV